MDLLDLINLPDTKVTNVSKAKYNEVHITIEMTEQSTACQQRSISLASIKNQ